MFDQIQSQSVEIAAMNTKMGFLNADRIQKYGQTANLLSANCQLSDAMQRWEDRSRWAVDITKSGSSK